MLRKLLHLLVDPTLVALSDMCLTESSLFAVLLLEWQISPPASHQLAIFIHLLPLTAAVHLALLWASGLYGHWLPASPRLLAYRLAAASALLASASGMLYAWEARALPSLATLAGSGCLQLLLLGTSRLGLRHLYWLSAGRSRVMVMANDEDQALALLRRIESGNTPPWMQLVGYLVPRDLEHLEGMARLFDQILVAPGFVDTRTLHATCTALNKHLLVVPTAGELCLLRSRAVEVDDVLMLSLTEPQLSPGERGIKRIFDVAVSLFMLLVLSPLLAVIAVAIRLTSSGPAIFRQGRVGRHGREYTVYKFRTMVADAERGTGPVLARRADPRITRLGQFLRSTRLDELPQLFNVLSGQMSIVGPRPERRFFVSQFRDSIPGYDLRHTVKPGITGLAQVAGSYATPAAQKLAFDMLYIYDYSLVADLRILLRTCLVVFHAERAAGLKVASPSFLMEER